MKRVTVGYVSPFHENGAFDPNATPVPVKYQDYLFKKNGSEYYLYAIVESETKGQTAGSAATAQTAQSTAPQDALESLVGESLPTTAESVPPADEAQNAVSQPAA